MRVKAIVAEDFVNYKKPSMFISTCFCDWKCCKDGNFDISVCQNSSIYNLPNIEINNNMIYNMYNKNPITHSVVVGGLEPIIQFDELLDLIFTFRKNGCEDDFVIYTGYKKNEILYEIEKLRKYKNIVVKFGRFIPGEDTHFDNVLGIFLASNNQYAERIS